MTDLSALRTEMNKNGYEPGYGYGYGYSMMGYGYGYPRGERPATVPTTTSSAATSTSTSSAATRPADDYVSARPGYELQTLLASANILAREGQQQPCEDVLAATRDLYKRYGADLRGRGYPEGGMSNWERQQIAAAQPVATSPNSFRSADLIGTEVRSLQNDDLGRVQDIVMSPHKEQVAYLVLSHGGFLGIDEKYVPVPWTDFKTTSAMNMLVLDTNAKTMAAAPQVKRDQFSNAGHFDQMSQTVDTYWKSHMMAGTEGNAAK